VAPQFFIVGWNYCQQRQEQKLGLFTGALGIGFAMKAFASSGGDSAKTFETMARQHHSG
jgi:hypothetical protein